MENLQRPSDVCPEFDELKRTGLAPYLVGVFAWPEPTAEPSQFVLDLLEQHQEYRGIYPPVTLRTPSLWHLSCNHRTYNLTCEQYEQLLRDAHYVCQRCKKPSGRLYIDHDHALGSWGVRGLLCPWCNNHTWRVESGRSPMDEATASYLASPPEFRRPFPVAPYYPLHSLIGLWEYHNRIPERLRVGWASPYPCDVAIRRVMKRLSA